MRMRSLREFMVSVAFVALFSSIALRTGEAVHRYKIRAFKERLANSSCVFAVIEGMGKPSDVKVIRCEPADMANTFAEDVTSERRLMRKPTQRVK
jgi:hypothetical protein